MSAGLKRLRCFGCVPKWKVCSDIRVFPVAKYCERVYIERGVPKPYGMRGIPSTTQYENTVWKRITIHERDFNGGI